MGDDEFHIPESTEFTVEDLHELDGGILAWDHETEVDDEVVAWARALTLPSTVDGVDHSVDHGFGQHAGEAYA
jgi:hypothetical protein